MGTDIHVFAELAEPDGRFEALVDGAFLLPRDYSLFAALAGVRAWGGFRPLIAPRGLPANVSPEVSGGYFVPVLSDKKAAIWRFGEYYTPEQAAAAVQQGTSHWLPAGTTTPLLPSDGGYISHPDRHTASWLSVDEVRRALAFAGLAEQATPRRFQLLVGYLASAEVALNARARVVFWFDN